VERHQRFEVGEIRGRLRVRLLLVDDTVRLMVLVMMVMMLVLLLLLLVMLMVVMMMMMLMTVLVLLMRLVLRGMHGYRRPVGRVLIATQQIVQLGGVQHEFRAVLVQEMLVELQHFYH